MVAKYPVVCNKRILEMDVFNGVAAILIEHIGDPHEIILTVCDVDANLIPRGTWRPSTDHSGYIFFFNVRPGVQFKDFSW
jgi:hypothetical protein